MKITTILKFKESNRSHGWYTGLYAVDGKVYEIHAQIFEDPSYYGINGSRLSKFYVDELVGARADDPPSNILLLRKNLKYKISKLVEYERGWSIKPKTSVAKKLTEMILAMFPEQVDEEDKEPENNL